MEKDRPNKQVQLRCKFLRKLLRSGKMSFKGPQVCHTYWGKCDARHPTDVRMTAYAAFTSFVATPSSRFNELSVKSAPTSASSTTDAATMRRTRARNMDGYRTPGHLLDGRNALKTKQERTRAALNYRELTHVDVSPNFPTEHL